MNINKKKYNVGILHLKSNVFSINVLRNKMFQH